MKELKGEGTQSVDNQAHRLQVDANFRLGKTGSMLITSSPHQQV